MYAIQSLNDTRALVKALNTAYPMQAESLRLHRDWIGTVYVVRTPDDPYILKIYRPFHTRFAINSTGILAYLAAREYPAARIVPTRSGEAYIWLDTPAGSSVAMLYPMITGSEPDPRAELLPIAAQLGELHRVMAAYPGEIHVHGKEHYVGRYLRILKTIGFSQRKLADLTDYGDALWSRFSASARGFCHGDYHCGNMLRDGQGRYWLFDFDAACISHPSADIATMCDHTDYFHLQDEGLENTARAVDKFLPAYEKARGITLDENDVRSIYAFIAIRHYDIQATITECQGYTMQNLENQHRWLMAWRELIERNGY